MASGSLAIRYPAPTQQDLRGLTDFLATRGWVIEDVGHPGGSGAIDPESGWKYPASYAGAVMNQFDDITPAGLLCFFRLERGGPEPELVVISAGNYNGCRTHAQGEWCFPSSGRTIRFTDLAVLFDELEPAARELDPRELIECRFFGPCGRS